MNMRVGSLRLSTKELMLSNCGAREDSWEFLGHKEIKPVNPKGNQPWILIEMTDAETGAPVPWPPVAKSWLIGKDPDAGKDWGQEEEMTEDEIVGWHYWMNRHEFEQTLGGSEGQGGLGCCSLWGHKESNMSEQLNSNRPFHVCGTVSTFCETLSFGKNSLGILNKVPAHFHLTSTP